MDGTVIRRYAPSELVSGKFVHSAEYMRLSLNPGGGKGGICFGDSGGPDLLGGTNTVLAVNSYVTNVNCSGVGYSARVDIPEVLGVATFGSSLFIYSDCVQSESLTTWGFLSHAALPA
jgi:hypothetical protein